MRVKIRAGALISLLGALCLYGCGDSGGNGKVTADRIYVDGDIVTIDAHDRVAQALAVKGRRILAVGSRREIEALAGSGTETVNLQGKALLPGFIAAHEHPAVSAVFRDFIDMSGFSHANAGSAWRALRQAVADTADGEWVYAMGLDPILLKGLQMPHRDQLDAMAPRNPVFIIAQSLHSAWVNSAALAAMGIDEASPDPGEGAYYGRYADGRLNGALIEKQAIEPFLQSHKSPLRIVPAYARVLSDLRRAGYTSVASLGFNMPAWPARWASLHGLQPRIRQFYYYRGDNLEKLEGSPETNSDYFCVLGAKFWYDGSPYSGSMAMEQPYRDSGLARQLGIAPGSRGEPVVTLPELKAQMLGLHHRGWQTATHVQGDRAARDFLALLQSVRDSLPEAEKQQFASRRHRLEHGLLLDGKLLPQMAALGVTPSLHINHLYYYGDALKSALLGPGRAEKILPVKSAFALGMHPTLHADSPMFAAEPFSLMQTAITRRTRSGAPIGAHEAISPTQALRTMTINGAWQLGMEDKLGSLEPGKLADLVIVDRNPLQTPVEQWRQIKVERSILAGE